MSSDLVIDRSGATYAQWPSASDYASRLKKTVTKQWPFIDEEAIRAVSGRLEWFHIYLSRFNDRQFLKYVKKLTGRTLPRGADFAGLTKGERTRVESWLKSERDFWIKEQVRLITSLTDDHRSKAQLILQAHAGNTHAISEALQHQLGLSHTRAQLIADDQFTKGSAALDRARQQSVGAITYRWISRRDSRVRDSHADRDGQVWSYNAATHPGWEIRCRCHAEPIFPRNLIEPETEVQ